jgi:hypothetical protein
VIRNNDRKMIQDPRRLSHRTAQVPRLHTHYRQLTSITELTDGDKDLLASNRRRSVQKMLWHASRKLHLRLSWLRLLNMVVPATVQTRTPLPMRVSIITHTVTIIIHTVVTTTTIIREMNQMVFLPSLYRQQSLQRFQSPTASH